VSASTGSHCPDLASFGLVVFDKDGTLIDFDVMWAGWVTDLARDLEAELGRPIEASLYGAIGFDPSTGRAIAGGPLAAMPMGRLRRLTVEVVSAAERGPSDAEAIVGRVWRPPDPVALARPLADLPALFGALRRRGTRIAVATSDDRAPTEATLQALGVLGVLPLVDAIVCADDGLPVKPDPAMILHLCELLEVDPRRVAMVGDAPADLEMAGAAGVGLRVGVLSGVGRRADLEPLADVIVPSIASLTAG
jgi:phosphoglycolate phosphatase-like HAD superfamily hydrolase